MQFMWVPVSECVYVFERERENWYSADLQISTFILSMNNSDVQIKISILNYSFDMNKVNTFQ